MRLINKRIEEAEKAYHKKCKEIDSNAKVEKRMAMEKSIKELTGFINS